MAERHVFITGFPGFIARRLVKKLLASDAGVRITLLTEASRLDDAKRHLAKIDETSSSDLVRGVQIVTGDITAMDIGLSGSEFRELANTVTEIYHLAAVHQLGVDRPTANRVNVQGTENILDFAAAVGSLDRVVYFSSAYVSGRREGVILESELDQGQAFRNPYEATKHEAERRVQAARARLPITVVRPSAVVGDSHSGEIDRFDGVYHVGLLLAASPISFPLPGEGSAPLNIVPVDYVVDAVHALVEQPDTIGKTFHVVDPNPLSVRSVFGMVAEAAGRKTPRYGVSPNLTKALLRIPGLERIAPMSHQVIDYLSHMAFYNSRNTSDALEGTGLRCPPFDNYVENLVQYAKQYFNKR